MDHSNDVEISVVMPVYREARHLERVLDAVTQVLDSIGCVYEIVLVDDGSDDDTWNCICEYSASHSKIYGLRLSRNFGKEAALCAGVMAAGGAAIITMDADLQHPAECIPLMVRRWREGDVDVVEAMKRARGSERFVVGAASRLFYMLLKRLAGVDLSRATDFKLIDQRIKNVYSRMGERALFFRGMIAWLGFSRAEIPFDVPERIGGQSKWTMRALTGLAINSLTAFSSSPLRIVIVLGAGFFLLALVLVGRSLWLYCGGNAVAGFTTVVIVQLIEGSCVLIGLGIIGEYIARIYEEVKARPRYVIRDSTKGPILGKRPVK